MEHLIDFFDRYIRGRTEALVYDDGFRRWSYTHDQLRATAEAFAVGSLAETFRTYATIGPLLPAMGYSDQQVRDLETTIDRVPCDVVVVGTPFDLSRLVKIRQRVVRVRYELQEIGQPDLAQVITGFLARLSIPAPACTRHGKVMAIAGGDSA